LDDYRKLITYQVNAINLVKTAAPIRSSSGRQRPGAHCDFSVNLFRFYNDSHLVGSRNYHMLLSTTAALSL